MVRPRLINDAQSAKRDRQWEKRPTKKTHGSQTESTQSKTQVHYATWRCTFCQKRLILWKEAWRRDLSTWRKDTRAVHESILLSEVAYFVTKKPKIWKGACERDLLIWSVHRAMCCCTFCQKRLIIWIEAYESDLSMWRESTQSSTRVHHANVAHFGHLPTTITRMNKSIHIHKKDITQMPNAKTSAF